MEDLHALHTQVTLILVSLAMVASAASFRDEVLADAPLAYYRLDETAGTVAADASGNSHWASYAGNVIPQLGVPGFTHDENPGAQFSGSAADASVVLVPGVLNPGETSFTLEALVSVEALGINRLIFQQLDLNGTGRSLLRILANGELASFIGGINRTSGKIVPIGQPLHVAMVFERTGLSGVGEAEGTLSFYVNGVRENSLSLSGSEGVEMSDGDFVLGNQKGLNGQYFNGVMDEIVFYDKALSEARILEHFDSINEASQIIRFQADPPGVEPGQSTVLSWEVAEEVIALLMNPGVGLLEVGPGSIIVSPQETTTYLLSAANGQSVEQKSVTVEVGTIGPYRLSEIMADNAGPLEDEGGDESDWIEIRNEGEVIGSLAGWYLTDDAANLTKWVFPKGLVGGGGFLVVFASGKDRAGESGELHTNFRLSREGEYLALVEPDGVTVHDEIVGGYPAQVTGVSWGESGGETGYFLNPTPGAENGMAAAGFVEEEVLANVERGFFEQAFEVALSTAAVGAEIYFTTDGSEPTVASGQLYSGPMMITTTTTLRAGAFLDGKVPSKVMTQTYLFLEDVLDQPNQPAGFPATWQPTATADYGMDTSAKVGTRAEIKTALRDLPTLSLVMEVDDWFDPSTDPAVGGIYSNSTIARGSLWERKVSAEFFDFPHGKEIQLDAGMRIFGNASRSTTREKHNMRLVFRRGYGPSKLVFPLFGEGSEDDEVNSYLLRGQNGDSWFHPTPQQQVEALYIRDQFSRQMQVEMGHPATKQGHIHVYLNGLYWGVFNTIERIEGDSMAAAYGGSKEDWDVIKASPPSAVVAEDGNMAAWQEVVTLADGGLTGEAEFAAIQEMLDLENFIDWLILNFYNGNSDWDNNNWQAARRRGGDDRFRFFVWDSERSLLGVEANSTTKNNVGRPTGIHQRLRQNEEYRMMFADRVHRHLFNGGALTPSVVAGVFNGFVNELRSPLIAESARWGDTRRAGNPYSVGSEWQAQVDFRKNSYFPGRTATVVGQLRAQGLYPAVDAPVFSQFGGEVPPGYELVISSPGNAIRYTLDGSDPRSGAAMIYGGPLVLNQSAILKARSLSNGVWSALTTTAFYVETIPVSTGNVVISEIHYHPASGDEGGEFVEIWNPGAEAVDLRGARIEGGIDFSFGEGPNSRLWVIGAGERMVLVGDETEFELVHGDLGGLVVGRFSGNLANGGERVALVARDGQLIDEVIYGDELPWPTAADGPGYSLVRTVRGTWRRSVGISGNPGTDDVIRFAGSQGLDSDGDGFDDLLEFALGTDALNPASGPEALRFEATGVGLGIRFPIQVAADEIRVLVEESTDLRTWVETGDLEMAGRFVLDLGRDQILLDVAGESKAKFLRLKVQITE